MGKPTKTVVDYSPARVEEFARQFRPQARRYRLQSKIGLVGFISIVVGSILLVPTWPLLFPVGLILAAAFWVIFAIRSDILPPCPACHGFLDARFGAFCPECGADLVVEEIDGGWRVCRVCRHPLSGAEKGRNYRIRNCTHCGLHLDACGL